MNFVNLRFITLVLAQLEIPESHPSVSSFTSSLISEILFMTLVTVLFFVLLSTVQGRQTMIITPCTGIPIMTDAEQLARPIIMIRPAGVPRVRKDDRGASRCRP